MTSFWLATRPIDATGTPLSAGESADVVVVGAGLTGLVTAALLARSGRRVALLEARGVGAVATGNTTAKASLLQGALFSGIRRRHSAEVLRAYADANRAGQDWLAGFLATHDVPYQRRTAWTYATDRDGIGRLEGERAAAVEAGLPVVRDDATGLPFPVAGAIRLDDQLQFHPTMALDALLAEFTSCGGVLHLGCRLRRLRVGARVALHTSGGDLMADQVVLATGTPVADRGGHFAVLEPQRSYALAAEVPGELPQGMYLSIDQPTRSLRTTPAVTGDGDVLLVGGNGHVVGRAADTRHRVDDLDDWTRRWFPGAEVTHRWSAQDYAPAAGLPLVGGLPWTHGRVFVATGYHKWGMTNAVAAGLRLLAQLDGGSPPDWASVLGSATDVTGWPTAARLTGGVGIEAVRGWFGGEVRSVADPPAEGQGVVGRRGLRPVAVSTVEGRTCAVSAVCTHLGGVVTWNEAERSWDCPLHGSRFTADGRVLEGPATTDLPGVERG